MHSMNAITKTKSGIHFGMNKKGRSDEQISLNTNGNWLGKKKREKHKKNQQRRKTKSPST